MSNNHTAAPEILPALSIIVPVYNAEPWLARCLDSLVNQTVKNIEIIVIDDHSADGSLNIIREYEKNEPRIHTIALEINSGASVARNAGLAIAAGEYIGFVDADDFVDLNFYEKLYTHAKTTGADIIKGEALEVAYDGNTGHYGPSCASIRKNRAAFSYPFWSAIYRRDFLTRNKLDFPVGIIVSEDIVFLRKAVILANTIELVEGVYYHYIRRTGSLGSKSFHGVDKLKSSIDGRNLVVDFINEKVAGDRETYNHVFQSEFMYIFDSLYDRHRAFAGQLMGIRGVIGLYAKCAYKDDLDRALGAKHAKLLSEGNEVGLFTDINEMAKEGITSFKLFNCIPLLQIRYGDNTVKVRLCNLIPLLKVKKKRRGVYYRLFSFLPIMNKTT